MDLQTNLANCGAARQPDVWNCGYSLLGRSSKQLQFWNGHRLPGFADFTIEIHHLGNPVFKTVFGIGGNMFPCFSGLFWRVKDSKTKK